MSLRTTNPFIVDRDLVTHLRTVFKDFRALDDCVRIRVCYAWNQDGGWSVHPRAASIWTLSSAGVANGSLTFETPTPAAN
jgi:hypothetical protein